MDFNDFCSQAMFPEHVAGYGFVYKDGSPEQNHLRSTVIGMTRRDFIFTTVLSKALEKLPGNEASGFLDTELKMHLKRVTDIALRALYEITFPE